MPPLIVAAFLFVHGAIHLSYLSPRPPATATGPAWPFVLGRSWILSRFGVPPGRLRIMGLALSAVTFAAFTLAALAVIGVLPAGLWLSAVAMGAGSSLALLVLFFHPWLVLGVAIDVLLLVAIFIGDWSAVTLPI
ncbi:MAG TPA: hypothetical protein VFM38_01780 [Candidatus Limnocylindrales bacterium]|nr:hypothetical protein [Candidatus Limnocylindrales bacterium]